MSEHAPIPPQNPEAEESVLGAMLLSPHAIAAVAEEVTATDFYRPSHGLIFTTALNMDARGEAVDAITLLDELERTGNLDKAGGKVRLHELASLVPSTANSAHYARIVRETAQRRNLIRAGDDISRLGWEGNGSNPDLLARAESMVAAVAVSATPGDFESLGTASDEFVGRLAAAVESGQPLYGFRTGLPRLDKVTTGLHPGQLVVIAARPSMGKSLLAQNIGENMASRGEPVAMFSLEMSKEELFLRSLIRQTEIEATRLRTGKISTDELARVRVAAGDIRQRPFFVEDNGSVTMTELRARARRMKAKHGLSLLIVDYLQLMLSESGKESRNVQVAELSRSLKLLAKDLRVPVIAISQLNRNLEYRDDKRPTLADLRDSGAVEQDADVVLFLYREEMYQQVDATKGGETEIIVAKNRMGERDTIYALFLGRRQLFTEPAKH